MLSLEDIAQTYTLTAPGQRMSFLLFELVYEAVHRALQERQETARVQTPVIFAGQTEKFIHDHGMIGRLDEIFLSPESNDYLDWLRSDAVVACYSKSHPEVFTLLDKWALAARSAQKVKL
jgi:hypothetical protein